MVVDVAGVDKSADGAELLDAAQKLLAGEVDVLHGEHGGHLELVGTMLAEFVEPVVVGAGNGVGELRVHAGPVHEAEAKGGKEDGDIDALGLHGDDLGLGIEATLAGEVDSGVRAGEAQRVADPVVLHRLLLLARRLGIDEEVGEAAKAAFREGGDPVLEGRVQVPLEQVRRLHDVHVAVNESEPLFHWRLLSAARGVPPHPGCRAPSYPRWLSRSIPLAAPA